MHIALITGGTNSERPISLLSAQAVKKGLETMGYTTIGRYDFPEQIIQFTDSNKKNPYDFVFLMIHGVGGEDGQVASFLDLLDIPYQCTSPAILALTMNKWHTKLIWRAHGLPVADDICIIPTQTTKQSLEQKIQFSIGFPCVRKELNEGSSKGIYILNTKEDLAFAREIYHNYNTPVLIETFLEGKEITIPILDQRDGAPVALPLIHIVPPKGGKFDYENKYNGKTQENCPSGFSEEIIKQINNIALTAYCAVGCTKYARIDAILTTQGPVLLEINTIPGFTSQSLFPKSAAVAGYSFTQLLNHLITLSTKNI